LECITPRARPAGLQFNRHVHDCAQLPLTRVPFFSHQYQAHDLALARGQPGQGARTEMTYAAQTAGSARFRPAHPGQKTSLRRFATGDSSIQALAECQTAARHGEIGRNCSEREKAPLNRKCTRSSASCPPPPQHCGQASARSVISSGNKPDNLLDDLRSWTHAVSGAMMKKIDCPLLIINGQSAHAQIGVPMCACRHCPNSQLPDVDRTDFGDCWAGRPGVLKDVRRLAAPTAPSQPRNAGS